MSIFDHGATLVPDVVTEAEEERILLRISQAPWMTDLSRRVQHYGFRYGYRQRGTGRHDPAAPFPALGRPSSATGLRRCSTDGGPSSASSTSTGPARGSACTPITQSFGDGGGLAFTCRRVDDELPAPFRQRPYVRGGLASDEIVLLPRRSALVLRGPARSSLDARDRSRLHRGPQRDASFRDIPHHRLL